MMIKTIAVGFEVSNIDLESTSNRSEYKDLLKDIIKNYPTEVETLDSVIKVYSSSSGEYLVYQYLVSFDSVATSPKYVDKLLGSFKKSVINSMENFLKSLGLIYKLS